MPKGGATIKVQFVLNQSDDGERRREEDGTKTAKKA
jgi:hypothetical protein